MGKKNYSDNEFLSLKHLADAGSADAQFLVGTCYEHGNGVKQSYHLASKYYNLAADQGHASGQFFLGMLYEEGLGVEQSAKKAYQHFLQAANNGNDGALVYLGQCYEKGTGVEQSYTEAFRCYEKAAEMGSIAAWTSLADAYEKGIGVEKSDDKSSHYRQKIFQRKKEGADRGDAGDQARVGWYYETGYGVVQSIDSAIKYYQLSAGQNDQKGQYHLGECYEEGIGVPKSSEKAIHYYTLSAEQGDVIAQANLGILLTREKIDFERGVQHLKNIAEGHVQCSHSLLGLCQYHLGKCYEEGSGIKKSAQKALMYYKLAAENGISSALRDRYKITYTISESKSRLTSRKTILKFL